MSGDNVTVNAVLIYALIGYAGKGAARRPILHYIHETQEGFELQESRKGAALFSPPDAQKFIRAAGNCRHKLQLQAVK